MVAPVGGQHIWMGFDRGEAWEHFFDESEVLGILSSCTFPTGPYGRKKKPTMRTTTSKPMLATITSRYHYLGGGIEGPNVSGGRPILGAAGNAGRGGQR